MIRIATFLSLFWFILFGLVASDVNAQCLPDSSVSGLYSPTLNEGLPDGQITVAYDAVITINVPTDTTYLTLTAQIDSMNLVEVTGLPPGFSYECLPASCSFPAGEYSCIRLTGLTSDNANAGTWDIEADFQFFIKNPAITLPYTLVGYSITLDSVALGLHDFRKQDFRFYIEPNPISDVSRLVFDLPESRRYSLDVYSLLGSKVVHAEHMGRRGENVFSLSDFSSDPGVYFISIKQGNYTRSMRFIVQ